jgi:hypothetical protein
MRRISRKAVVRRPTAAFAFVAPGESLADVAVRIYGTADARELLWQANRDQLAGPDAPLRAGSSLRTPPTGMAVASRGPLP